MTKYEFVANQLADRINNNEFKHTKKIPTEDQLMQEYNVSKNTIRNAIKILTKLGLLYPVQGSGMFRTNACILKLLKQMKRLRNLCYVNKEHLFIILKDCELWMKFPMQ